MKSKLFTAKATIGIAFLVSVVFIMPTAHAQLGGISVPSLGGKKTSEPAIDVGLLMTEQKGLMGKFSSAMNNMMQAQASTLRARGLKDDADKLEAQADYFKSGNVLSSDGIKRGVESSVNASNVIAEKGSAQEKLSAEGKQMLVAAVPHYVKGLSDGVSLPKEFEKWTAVAQGGLGSLASNPMDAMKLKGGLGDAITVATNLPELLKAWSSTTTGFINYAKSNDVDVSSLEKLGDL